MRAQAILSSEAALADWLLSLQHGKEHLVVIDGMNRVGKSRLSRYLGAALNAPVFEADLFIRPGRGFYPEMLAVHCLRAAVKKALRRRWPVVVDTVLALPVLDALDVYANTHVYVRHNWPENSLTHAELFDNSRTEAQLLESVNTIAQAVGIQDSEPLLERELIQYHKRRIPHVQADVLFDATFNPNLVRRPDAEAG